jgi:ribosomal protein S18 acetylase RimI-like enzyme
MTAKKYVQKDTVIKRISEYDKDLIALLFTKAGEGQNIDPSPGFFKDPRNILLAAYTGGIASGFLYAYVLSGLKTPYPKMFLYSIDVFIEYRRRGIAGLLIAALKKLAKANRCSEIFVMTNKSNEAAMQLYAGSGGAKENGDDVLFVYDREAFTEE